MSPLALAQQAPIASSTLEPRPQIHRPCALIPTYENPSTVAEVVRGAQRHLPVIVVDDGSAPETAALLQRLPGIHLVRHAKNRGKGAALQSGFRAALALGYTHALSLDADGQHDPDDLPTLARSSALDPSALILGDRDLAAAGAGWGSRIGRVLSNAWLRWAGGPRLPDTQTGFRVYPLARVSALSLRGERYDLEVEVLARAAWAGLPLRSLPVRVRYFPPGERVSHMGTRAMLGVGRAWLSLLWERATSRRGS